VFEREGVVYRQVNEVHRPDFERLMSSGLYERLVADVLLIPHEDAELALAPYPGAARVLRPERIPFVSYPYEWSFLQLRDAALLTLEIQERAMDHGMSLRDATAYNVTFHRGRPVFIDTTSLGVLPEGRPWVAYRQFCQHFLAPLALMSRDPRLGRMMMTHIDGIPLDLASSLLPRRSTLSPGLLMHLRMHARSQARHAHDETHARTRDFSLQAFRGLVASLRKAIERLNRPTGDSVWRTYYEEADHYSAAAAAAKVSLVESLIEKVRPSSVWDFGANTGRFTRLASSRGIDTVGFEMDPLCVDDAYLQARRADDRHFLPLVLDLADPSPGIGWANVERSTLQARGPADLVMALALVHHLAIANNVPLALIARYLSKLGRRAIVEWVPKEDEKVQRLLVGRDDVFPDYSREGFEAAIEGPFHVSEVAPIGDSGRSLYLLEAS
jgi:hypothetical protein